MTFKFTAIAGALAAGVSSVAMADDTALPFPGEITGNIGVYSDYVLRGNTNYLENDGATIQGGIDYAHPSGFYLGYWGSTLDYSLTDSGSRDAFENDFNIGYNGSITEDLGFTVGGTYYYYYESDVDSDVFEVLLGLNYKDFSLTTQTITQDVVWGNAGDTYILGSYSHPLPKDFTLNAAVGLYYYKDSGDYEADLNTTETFNFRHATLGLSHPLGTTGADWSLNYIIGGKTRSDEDLKNKVVLGLSYAF
ncbi:MAG: TorF family putative porin [Acinetobacter populi]|jgi:uncharacterized protein (TIGR02001 family)|uniref:TorF family putative porin n=1 Tax=Acinetobacter populi TaxID=1582270 RepID=UPI0023562089|nr:TorF family putative porin [Acinetobacter populi]MCH4247668.1 TorF family putative porin [Acinetobacter populi]